MKIKLVVVDFEIPPRVKRWAVRLCIPALVLGAFGALAYGSVKHTFATGNLLTASDLNENFQDLDARIPTRADLIPLSFFLPGFVQVSYGGTYTDDYRVFVAASGKIISSYDMSSGGQWEERDLTSLSVTAVTGIAKIGTYLYALTMTNGGSPKLRMYRFPYKNLAAAGTPMTPAAAFADLSSTMITDGSSLYVNNYAGTSAALNGWRKYTISDTTLTSSIDVTPGAANDFSQGAAMDSQGNFYGLDSTCRMRRYPPDGSSGVAANKWPGTNPCFLAVVEGLPYFALDEVTAHGYLAYLRAPLLP